MKPPKSMRQRLQYFDMMKGLAIYMVVMGHIFAFCTDGPDGIVLFRIIGCVHMPLFFFVAGWFSYRIDKNTGALQTPSLSKRFMQLMIPMAIVPLLWVWFMPHSGLSLKFSPTISGLWHHSMKYGYWFTLCLFEIVLIYTLTAPLLRKCRNLFMEIATVIAAWILCYIFFKLAIPEKYHSLIGTYNIICYLPVFFFGILASRHRNDFLRIAQSPAWVTGAILLLIPTLYYNINWEFFKDIYTAFPQIVYIITPTMHICLALIAIAVIKPWAENAFAYGARPITRGIASIWAFLGRKSLAIYLLHYFFLFPLGFCRDTLTHMHLAFVPIAVFSFVIAGCIIACVLMVNAIISKSPLLALLLTGETPFRASCKTKNPELAAAQNPETNT